MSGMLQSRVSDEAVLGLVVIFYKSYIFASGKVKNGYQQGKHIME